MKILSIIMLVANFGWTTAVIGQPPAQDTGEEVSDSQVDAGTLRLGMSATPRAFRLAAEEVQPSLVAIESFGGSSTSAGRIGGIRRRGEGNTTGVIISADGLVATSSFNFVDQPAVITVLTSDGVRRVATVLGRDDTRRICLLRIEDVAGLTVPEMVPVDEVRVGQWAVSVGVGYGDARPAISMGIISAMNRAGGRAIQTDANISPANYGGPLIDIEGRLIGICVPMSGEGDELASGVEWYDSGIGFAIPLAGEEELIRRLSEGRHIQRAFLGIQSENADEGQNGITVTEVVAGSAAESAGLKKDDVLIRLDEHELPNIARLREVLALLYAGDSVTVIYRRGDSEESTTVELGAPPRPESADTPSRFPGRRRSPK